MASHRLDSLTSLCCLVVGLAFGSSSPYPPPPPVTDYERQLLESTVVPAEEASKAAEAEVLEELGSLAFKAELLFLGDHELARLSPVELLAKLRLALDSVEVLTNFGISPAQRSAHPGMSSPNITTLKQWGYYPGIWQLVWANSSLEKDVPQAQFRVYDDAEVNIYGLKPFSAQTSKTFKPTWEEAAERPVYSSINIRRLAAGHEVFGPFALVYRGRLVKERTIMVPVDDGAWEDVCNKSINLPQRKWWWSFASLLFDCTSMGGAGYDKPGWRPVPARMGSELHTLTGNAKGFRHVGISLGRLLAQILSPKAAVSKMELFMYTEAVILGAVTMSDLKFILLSFQDVFGTDDGDEAIAFCKQFRVPCLWGLGYGLSPHEQHFWNNLPPPFGFPGMPVGQSRIVDPATIEFTNCSALQQTAASNWAAVDREVRAYRALGKETEVNIVKQWWAELGQGGTVVHPQYGGECANTDLVLGVEASSGKCVIRSNLDADILVV